MSIHGHGRPTLAGRKVNVYIRDNTQGNSIHFPKWGQDFTMKQTSLVFVYIHNFREDEYRDYGISTNTNSPVN